MVELVRDGIGMVRDGSRLVQDSRAGRQFRGGSRKGGAEKRENFGVNAHFR